MTVTEAPRPVAAAPDRLGSRSRRVDVEALRVLAAILIVTIHATSSSISGPERTGEFDASYWLALVTNEASRCAVPVFFAISGWALLSRSHQADEARWLGGRLTRLLVPLLVWNLIFIGDAWAVAPANGTRLWTTSGGPGDWLLREATAILAGPGTRDHLWFMYYLVALTMVLWLVQVAPRVLVEIRTRWVAGCVAAAVILPYGLAPAFHASVSWDGFGWALGYAVLGYLVFTAKPPSRSLSLALYLGSVAALVVLERLTGYNTWPASYFGPLVLAATIGLIGVLRSISIPGRWQPATLAAAKLTFGVYLVHPLVLDLFRVTIGKSSAPDLLVLVVSWLGAVVLSFGLAALWHRARLGRVLG